MPQTRRDFLKQVGIAGGAGVMLHSMGALGLSPAAAAETPPFTPPKASELARHGRKRVLILGGGIAGLTTAYELGKAGYRCTILEARDRPGGRSWSVRGGTTETDLKGQTQRARFSRGQYMNAGPARLPQHHVTVDYCRELGVELETFVNQNADAYLYRTGAHNLAGQPIRHRAAKADVYGYVSELLAKATDQGALDTYLTQADKDALIALLRNFGSLGAKVAGDPSASYRYTGSGRRGYAIEPGVTAGEPIAPYALSDVLASGIGNYFSFELGFDQAMQMLQPVGGMDRIAYAFERAIGRDKIEYGAEVSAFGNTSTGVEVEYSTGGRRTKKATADFLVCTIPPHLAATIPSNLPPEVVSALAYARPSNAGKIGLEYDRRWWELDHKIYGGITNADNELGNVWYPSSGFHGERGTMIGYYNTGSNATTYGTLTPRGRLAKALDQGAAIHGDVYKQDLRSSFSVDWASTKYSEGAWVGWPSRTDGNYDRLLEPSGNVYFAGDHLSYTIAWQHGAMVSARAAVESLHTRVVSA
ncbi:flavin monoamine oxidase family protein [Mumia sp. zg.B53]|uniref:flavin monoamine oxidase family protein n=1 Tax=unclassified Mumia TaxID=2621872 RepID=UPI001C6E3301|nr:MULTISPECIES: flavin monoamine oxidase family protein [unclassified Mumia]MBW9205305.1 flavin monoamine oxidase family protein [Mumia sp. zg.B17]MBW9208696.1 flavin monoamine oxidase family protein [Mumia sp. zg.B21]MBW9213307.1 flavin monoamine oxidase family protein [Mumia sp. zg.B53]MDD9348554.1 flavin monoamine oxidase family protein [Mumia sp.]